MHMHQDVTAILDMDFLSFSALCDRFQTVKTRGLIEQLRIINMGAQGSGKDVKKFINSLTPKAGAAQATPERVAADSAKLRAMLGMGQI